MHEVRGWSLSGWFLNAGKIRLLEARPRLTSPLISHASMDIGLVLNCSVHVLQIEIWLQVAVIMLHSSVTRPAFLRNILQSCRILNAFFPEVARLGIIESHFILSSPILKLVKSLKLCIRLSLPPQNGFFECEFGCHRVKGKKQGPDIFIFPDCKDKLRPILHYYPASQPPESRQRKISASLHVSLTHLGKGQRKRDPWIRFQPKLYHGNGIPHLHFVSVPDDQFQTVFWFSGGKFS